eukprot:INCI3147.8.p1 GENE.INCI3147.8~~INCI3147.8.p1  ORF type:complete len:569 (-),score=77.94 INCI3147.8:473-2179(-)
MPRDTAAAAELRVDRSDGNAYPLESFLEVYGAIHGRAVWGESRVYQLHCSSESASSRSAPVKGQQRRAGSRRKRKFHATSNHSRGSSFFNDIPALAFVSICSMCTTCDLASLSQSSVVCRKRCFCRLRWRRLGCPRVVLAPMVDQSELAFRQFCRQIGCRLAYSPMLHASVIVRSASADSTKLAEAPKSEFVTNTMNSTADSNQQSSDTVSVTQSAYLGTFFKTCREDRPLAIQLAGSSVQELSAAAGLVAHMCDIVDLNVGCPQAMAQRRGFGAFLDRDWPKLKKIVRSMRCALERAIALPKLRPLLGCKIRVQGTVAKTVRYAQLLVNAGCEVLCVHGRTKVQRGRGLADWRHICAVRNAVDVIVIANGNILGHLDIEACFQETHVDAVMVGETALHNPYIFQSPTQPTGAKGGVRADVAASQYLEVCQRPALDGQGSSTPPVSWARAHLLRLWRKFISTAKFASLKNNLSKVDSFEGLQRCVGLCTRLMDDGSNVGHNMQRHFYCSAYVRRARLEELFGNQSKAPAMFSLPPHTTQTYVASFVPKHLSKVGKHNFAPGKQAALQC